jgi:glycosyltransferase involved in cell wall biosynthesis
MIRKVLWLGPAFTIAESLAATALAPAASRWQEGFLSGLRDAGAAIGIVANHTERLWPRGPARVAGSSGRFCGIARDSVAYMNLPGLREGSLARRYGQAIDRFCVNRGMPDVIASYNAWRPVAHACRQAGRKHGIPWIPVLLDHDPPTAGWANVLKGVAGSAGVVFLSHWAFLHAPIAHKLHLDAGVARVPPLPATHVRSRVVLYSGALHRWAGIDLLLDAMQHVRTPGVRLVVVGRGGSAETMQRLATMPSVEYLGAVDEATLQSLTEQAEVLANPRPGGVGGNEMNFPSKLLHYLSSLKPVATTLTPGVAPEYADVVLGSRDDSPQGFADALDRALSLTDDARMDLSGKIRAFLAGGRLWSQQARRFLEWTSLTTRS